MAKKPTPTYVIKVALRADKKIWRRIAIRGDQTLDDLHEAIFSAFDRYDEHLYSFLFPPGVKGRDRRRFAREFTHPYALEGGFDDHDAENAAKTKISQLGLAKGQQFEYMFDFGDCWEHVLSVEETDANAEKGRYPRILESEGKSPPQYPDPGDEDE